MKSEERLPYVVNTLVSNFKLYFLLIDHPVEPGRTPTESHTGLKNLIDALVEEIREDTAFQVLSYLQHDGHGSYQNINLTC